MSRPHETVWRKILLMSDRTLSSCSCPHWMLEAPELWLKPGMPAACRSVGIDQISTWLPLDSYSAKSNQMEEEDSDWFKCVSFLLSHHWQVNCQCTLNSAYLWKLNRTLWGGSSTRQIFFKILDFWVWILKKILMSVSLKHVKKRAIWCLFFQQVLWNKG